MPVSNGPADAPGGLGEGREQCGVSPVLTPVELDEGSRRRTARHADRDALGDARREQPGDTGCEREQAECDRAHGQPAEDDGAAADPIRELAEDQQRRRERERVDGEDEREHEAVEAEALAVDGVERRREVRSEQEGGQRDRHDRLAGCGPQSERHGPEHTPRRFRPGRSV